MLQDWVILDDFHDPIVKSKFASLHSSQISLSTGNSKQKKNMLGSSPKKIRHKLPKVVGNSNRNSQSNGTDS